jgi:RNA polymerase sigma-70 factor (ECF subfamily)
MDPSDEELVRRFSQGDRASFEELVRRHERRVYNLALRMLGRDEDARDATQDAFLSALRKVSSFRGDAAFTTWLHRVTVNACYDMLRRRARGPLLELDSELPPPEPRAGVDPAEAAAVGVDVRRALVQVPEEFRAVLVLHDVQDMVYDDVAAVLGIPVGTVKSRLHRGRVMLARALGHGDPAWEPTKRAAPSDGEP